MRPTIDSYVPAYRSPWTS